MEIRGIDMEDGLASVNQDEEVYREILQIYYDDGAELLEVLKQGLQHTDLSLFITHTHALKSASKGVGANEVSERFKEMEFAGKDKNMELIEERLPSCLAALEALLGEIKQYLNDGSQETDDQNNFERMKAALEEMDTDLFERLLEQEEGHTTNETVSMKLHKIRAAYEEFDFAGAESLLEQLL